MARGGKREGAGRPKGQRSAATKDQIAGISELARMHSDKALSALVQIATCGESEAARVSAANSILDRAFGKPMQAVEMSGRDGGPIQHEEVARDADRFTSRVLGLAAGVAGEGNGPSDGNAEGGA